MQLAAKAAQLAIQRLAENSAQVKITDHACERMEERGFTTRDLFLVLCKGTVEEKPIRTDQGDWKCKIVKRLPGQREAGVVTVIQRNNRLIIVTMEWEDLR